MLADAAAPVDSSGWKGLAGMRAVHQRMGAYDSRQTA
jgi:hypothetical protein